MIRSVSVFFLRLPPLTWLLLPFALLSLPLLFSEKETNYTWDETHYYLPAVAQIRTHWPLLDLKADSLSATAPGYPYFLAGLSFVTGTDRLALRAVNWIVSLGVLLLFYFAWPAGAMRTVAPLAILPLACSNFFVKSSVNVVTDNAALALTTAALISLLVRSTLAQTRAAGFYAAAAIFVRQSQIWVLTPLALKVYRTGSSRWRYLTLGIPMLTFGWLILSWGGLTPPEWRETHRTSLATAPAAGAYLLAVLGLLGGFYYVSGCSAGWQKECASRWTAVGALGGATVAALSPTLPDMATGRWGGYLWSIAGMLPAYQGRSLLFTLMAALGGAIFVLLSRRLWSTAGATQAILWLGSMVAWMSSAVLNRQIFHRYYEPSILVFLICWLLLVLRSKSGFTTQEIRTPLIILAGGQLALTLVTAYGRTFGFSFLP